MKNSARTTGAASPRRMHCSLKACPRGAVGRMRVQKRSVLISFVTTGYLGIGRRFTATLNRPSDVQRSLLKMLKLQGSHLVSASWADANRRSGVSERVPRQALVPGVSQRWSRHPGRSYLVATGKCSRQAGTSTSRLARLAPPRLAPLRSHGMLTWPAGPPPASLFLESTFKDQINPKRQTAGPPEGGSPEPPASIAHRDGLLARPGLGELLFPSPRSALRLPGSACCDSPQASDLFRCEVRFICEFVS